MMISNWKNKQPGRTRCDAAGMTLVEMVVAILIAGIAVGCMVSGYVFSINSAERSALSLAATARATERLEETRSAKWDIMSYPVTDELTNTSFPNTFVALDVAASGTNVTYATNITTIYQVSSDPALRGIRVDCVWRFRDLKLVTNTVETVRGPD